MTKNETLLSSILGTWSATVDVRSDIGNNRVHAEFIMFLTCNPMKGYRCEMDECDEIDNEICQKPTLNVTHNNNTCERMEDIVSDWSDVSAYFHLSLGLDAGPPINYHETLTSNGWLGPYGIIMAHNETAVNDETKKGAVLDSFTTKYVFGADSPYLRMDPNNTLFRESLFEDYFGSHSLNNTVYTQMTNPFNTSDNDPYEPYYKTCDNGSVKPILPLFSATLIDYPDDDEGMFIDLVLNYKLLTFPKDEAFKSTLKKLQDKGAPIGGPYCYDGEDDAAWSVDIFYDSEADNMRVVNLKHSCVDELPCTPLAEEYCAEQFNLTISDKPEATTVAVGPVITLTCVVIGFIMILFCSICLNLRRKRIIQRLEHSKRHVHLWTDNNTYTSVSDVTPQQMNGHGGGTSNIIISGGETI